MEQHTEPTTIKDTVLEKIDKEHVAPRSRWYFRARHAALWMPGIFVTILGAFAIASILFSAVHSGWQYRSFTHRSLAAFLGEVVPFLWVVSLLAFAALIVASLRLTSKGYRYKTGMILLLSFTVSVFLGIALFALDAAVKQNKLIRLHAESAQRTLWSAPEDGRLAGTMLQSEDRTTLIDNDGIEWVLEISDGVPRPEEDELSVRVIGEKGDGNTFYVCRMFPWEFPRDIKDRSLPPPRVPRDIPQGTLSKRCLDIIGALSLPQKQNERNLAPRPY